MKKDAFNQAFLIRHLMADSVDDRQSPSRLNSYYVSGRSGPGLRQPSAVVHRSRVAFELTATAKCMCELANVRRAGTPFVFGSHICPL